MNEVEFQVGQQVLTLTSRPKHKAVKEVRNILTGWLLDRINLEEMTNKGEKSVEDVLQEVILKDPKIALEVQEIETSLLTDQTIMLATSLSYKELEAIKEEIYEDDYISLFKKAVDVLGGDANSFFESYASSST